MKILLTGAQGQLGRELRRSLAPLGAVTACDRRSLDLMDADALVERVRALRPDVIVNAAAYTAVDRAETEVELARAVNAHAPGILAEEAKALGAQLIHYSTDYVFDGCKETAYVETDTACPLGAYGRSKLEGEQRISATGGRHLIFRTSWVFGLHGANFMKTMLRLGKERDELRVVDDQFGAPTWTRLLADVTAVALACKDSPDGLYHLSCAGETSWHGYAEAIFAEAKHLGLLPTGMKPVVRRIASTDYSLPSPRPANSRLNCTRFERDFGLSLPTWQECLALCLADAVF
jgi:dTDP-4-dehydrorhamnose reductase